MRPYQLFLLYACGQQVIQPAVVLYLLSYGRRKHVIRERWQYKLGSLGMLFSFKCIWSTTLFNDLLMFYIGPSRKYVRSNLAITPCSPLYVFHEAPTYPVRSSDLIFVNLYEEKKMRKENFKFRIYLLWIITSATGYQFISQNSVRISRKRKKMRKENFEFRIYLLWIITSVTGLSVYFAKFCSHLQKINKCGKTLSNFAYICCELSHQ